LFVGPIVLSIAWELLALWFLDEIASADLQAQPPSVKREPMDQMVVRRSR
jgi:hypothetical protein